MAEYDGYLPSAVATLLPRAALRWGPLQLSVRGALSRFESGSMAASGDYRGSWLSPALGRARLEVAGSGGALFYREDSPAADDVLGVARLHVEGDGTTSFWTGAGRGRVATEIARTPVRRVEAGLRGRAGRAWLTFAAEHTRAGAARYTDLSLEGSLARANGEVVLTGGLRADEGRGTADSFIETGAALRLSRRYALVMGAGRYLYDAATATPGARYFSLALRLATGPPRASPRESMARLASSLLASSLLDLPPPAPPPVVLVAESMTVEPDGPGRVRLLVRAPGASRVEVAGDFSDWQPVALVRDPAERWTVALDLGPGAHRVNLRVDGGPWGVPPGLPVAADDFGGSAGLIVVRQ